MQKNKSQVHLQKISKSQGSKLSLLTKKVGNLTVDVAKATQSKKDKRNAMRQERIEKKRKRDESIEELYDTEIEEEAASDSDMDMSESEDAPDGEDGDDKGSNEGTTEKAIPRKDERQKDTPCSWFQKGNCTRGDACFFSHEGIPDATKAPKGARGRPRQNAQPTRKRKQSKSPTLKNQKQHLAMPDVDGEGGSNVEEPRRKKRRPKKQSKKKKVSGTAKESK